MSEKRINGRIVLKHDVESNWKLATGFTPMAGEIIIYDIDSNYNYERIKIGDGVQNVNALPFADGNSKNVFYATMSKSSSTDSSIVATVDDKSFSYKAGTIVALVCTESLGKSNRTVNINKLGAIDLYTESTNSTFTSLYGYDFAIDAYDVLLLLYDEYNHFVVLNNTQNIMQSQLSTALQGRIEQISTNEDDIANLNTLVGDTSVSKQISDAVSGYLPLEGGELTGSLTIDIGGSSAIALYSPANSNGEQGYGRIYKNASATADYGLHLRDYTHGDVSDSCALVVCHNKSNIADMLMFANQVDGGSNTYYKIYGEHNKPLPADIGAAASTHTHSEYINPIVTYYAASTGMSADDLLVPTALVATNSELNAGLYNVTGGSFAYVMTLFYTSKTTTSRRMQIGMSYNSSTPRMAIRHYGANGWTPWARLVTTTELNTAIADVKATCLPKVTSITLRADYWVFNSNAYYQDVALNCVTTTSKVDLQPTYYQLAEWQTDGLAFSTESKKGVVRVWVTDVEPREDITIQVTVQEMLEV